MPYSIKKKGKGHKVCKKGSNKCFSKKPMSKGKTARQMKAIYANESLFHKIVNHALSESYDQQMNDMKAALNAPRESRDSGAVLLDDEGHYFEWWKDVVNKTATADAHETIQGTIYDKNDDFVTNTLVPFKLSAKYPGNDGDLRDIGLYFLELNE